MHLTRLNLLIWEPNQNVMKPTKFTVTVCLIMFLRLKDNKPSFSIKKNYHDYFRFQKDLKILSTQSQKKKIFAHAHAE